MSEHQVIIVGDGDTGSRVAQQLRSKGFTGVIGHIDQGKTTLTSNMNNPIETFEKECGVLSEKITGVWLPYIANSKTTKSKHRNKAQHKRKPKTKKTHRKKR